MLDTIQDKYEEDIPLLDRCHFYQLYRALLAQTISSADIIISTCVTANNRLFLDNFSPTVVTLDDSEQASEPETMMAMVMYQDVRFRIMIGIKQSSDQHIPLHGLKIGSKPQGGFPSPFA